MVVSNSFSVRIDSDVKRECESIYGELGINLTTAINVFLRKSIRAGGFPFDVRVEDRPDRKTLEAILETEQLARDPGTKKYSAMEALEELKR